MDNIINFKKKLVGVYLTDEECEILFAKCRTLGITGRAKITRLLEKLAVQDFVFLDDNNKKMLRIFFDTFLILNSL